MPKHYSRLILEVDPKIAEDFTQEAKKTKITKLELFCRVWELWKSQKSKKSS